MPVDASEELRTKVLAEYPPEDDDEPANADATSRPAKVDDETECWVEVLPAGDADATAPTPQEGDGDQADEPTHACPNCAPGYDCARGVYTPQPTA